MLRRVATSVAAGSSSSIATLSTSASLYAYSQRDSPRQGSSSSSGGGGGGKPRPFNNNNRDGQRPNRDGQRPYRDESRLPQRQSFNNDKFNTDAGPPPPVRRHRNDNSRPIPSPKDWSRPTRQPEQSAEPTPTSSSASTEDNPVLPERNVGREKERNHQAKLRRKEGRGSLLHPSDTDAKTRRKEEDRPKPKQARQIKPKLKPVQRQVFLPAVVTVNGLARQLGVKMRTLQNVMADAGMSDTRPDLILKFEEAEMLAAEFNLVAVVNEQAAFDIYPRPPAEGVQPLRPPVVTIMGHVDHGKTTLLDKLRSTSVAAGEAGGITQHIGAFSVPVSRATEGINTVTFLDTPGHAAFTAMRSRGAAVTDIVVLVVAADDGLMPQTHEVIQLVKSLPAKSVQLVVAINKVDKPDAQPDKVKHSLLAAGVELEEFGGEVPAVLVSGKTGEGLPELEETLATLAEMAELRAERDGTAEGYVIESKVEKGRGNVATVLVKRGALKPGDCIIAGTAWCKVRQIVDSNGKAQRSAGPGDPVLVTGWRDLPTAGDEMLGALEESAIKRAVENRKESAERKALMADVESINEQRRVKAEADEAAARAEYEERQRRRAARLAADGQSAPPPGAETAVEEEEDGDETPPDFKQLNLIVKADFSGTVEAVVGAISGIGNREAGVKIISAGVGEPTEGDVARASALGGHIIGFNVKPSKAILTAAARAQPKVEVHCDDVIYRLMEHVSTSVAAMLPPIVEARVTGEASIAKIFDINVKGSQFRSIAGCRVNNGTITKANAVRILRGQDRKVVYEGKLDQFKHVKKDVLEMRKGTECGMSFEGYQDLMVDDVVQSYYNVEIPRTL